MTDRNESDRTAAHDGGARGFSRDEGGRSPADTRRGPVVQFKRRRWVGPAGDDERQRGAGGAPVEEKQARTFRLPAPAPEAAGPVDGPAAPVPPPRAPSTPRARRDPMRRPGEVHRIVFDTPAAEREPAIHLPASSGFAEVIRSLDALRAIVEEARRARRFRIL